MELIEKNGLRILKAAKGMTIRRKGDDSASFSQTIYLGKWDTQDNYEEITKEQAERIIAEKERQMTEETTGEDE